MHGQDSDGVYEAFYLIIEMYFPSVKGFRPSAMASNGHAYFEIYGPFVSDIHVLEWDRCGYTVKILIRNKKNLFYPLNAFQKYSKAGHYTNSMVKY